MVLYPLNVRIFQDSSSTYVFKIEISVSVKGGGDFLSSSSMSKSLSSEGMFCWGYLFLVLKE